MSYTLNKTFPDATMADIDARTRAALANHGFGVLTEIDVQATMKKKIDVDMEPYTILGACNPKLALQAIEVEPRIGSMLPCNVLLRQVEGGIEVSAVDPLASFSAVGNAKLDEIASQVKSTLNTALAEI